MQGPNAVIYSAPGSIINHPYAVEAFLHVEIMNEADYRSDLNVILQSDRDHLLPDQLSILGCDQVFLPSDKLSKSPY